MEKVAGCVMSLVTIRAPTPITATMGGIHGRRAVISVSLEEQKKDYLVFVKILFFCLFSSINIIARLIFCSMRG